MVFSRIIKYVFVVMAMSIITKPIYAQLTASVDMGVTPQNSSLLGYVQQGDPNSVPNMIKDAESSENNVSENETKSTDKDSERTWLNNLVDTVANKGAEVITSSINKSSEENAYRTNASVFDISGVMLRMNSKQVTEAMQKRGYRKVSEKYEIPNFIRWRNEEECRKQGVIGFERVASCVVKLAQKKNYQYIQHLTFSNFRTKENMNMYFTSNFTGNKVYRIVYNTSVANIAGSGPKADYLRNIKVYDFWKKINQKYGVPDNKEQVIWGLGENKPYLQASTGSLMLYDPMLLELDYTRMSREDQRFMNTDVYTF